MEIKTECPWCKQHYSVDESFIGQDVECSVCGKQFAVRNPSVSTPSLDNSSIDDSSSWNSLVEENTFVPKNKKRKRFLFFTFTAIVIVLILLMVLYYAKSNPEKEFQKGFQAYNEHRYSEAVELRCTPLVGQFS